MSTEDGLACFSSGPSSSSRIQKLNVIGRVFWWTEKHAASLLPQINPVWRVGPIIRLDKSAMSLIIQARPSTGFHRQAAIYNKNNLPLSITQAADSNSFGIWRHWVEEKNLPWGQSHLIALNLIWAAAAPRSSISEPLNCTIQGSNPTALFLGRFTLKQVLRRTAPSAAP